MPELKNPEVNKRVKEIRDRLNLTQQEFAEKVHVGRATIASIEAGNINVTDRNIANICKEFCINETWLRTGQGSMEMSVDVKFAELSAEISMSDNALIKEIIEMLWQLDIDELEALKMVIKSMQKK